MKKEMIITKIVTYDGLFYTLNEHPREQILEILEDRKQCCTEEFTEEQIIDEVIKEDLCHLITSKEDLIWLPYENKIINKKEIKESLVQFR